MKFLRQFSFVILVVSACSSGVFADEIDSLKNVIAKLPDDSNKVNTLNELSKQLLNTDPKQTIEYATKAANLAHKIGYIKGEAYASVKLNLEAAFNKLADAFPDTIIVPTIGNNDSRYHDEAINEGDKEDFDNLYAEVLVICRDELPDDASVSYVCEVFHDYQLEQMNGHREIGWYL